MTGWSAWAWAGVWLAALAGVVALSWVRGLGARGRTAVAGGTLVILLLPWQGMPLASHLYVVTGAFSLPTLALLADRLARCPGSYLLKDTDRTGLLKGAAVAGIILYPGALGLLPWDPYALGYGGGPLPYLVCALAAVAWYGQHRGTAVVLLLAVWAWLGRMQGSDNLWDYLVDPWVCLVGLVAVARWLARRLRAWRVSAPEV